MLKDDFKKFLTDTLGVDVEALTKAIASEDEVEVSFKSDVTIMDDAALTSLKDDMKKAGYNEGKTAGVEIAIKNAREKYGLEFEGKTIDNFAESLKTKALNDAKIEPNKKIQDLTDSLSNLQKQYTTDIESKESEITRLQSEMKGSKIKATIQGLMPQGIKAVKPNQFATLIGMEYEFDYDENGNLVAKKNGTILKDKLEKPLPVADILGDFARNNGWVDKDGRGDGDAGGGTGSDKFKNMNEVMKHLEESKIDPMSAEGEKIIQEFKNS